MQYMDAIHEMFSRVKTNRSKVEKQLYNSKVITTSVARGTVMKIDSVAKIANACGYELCLLPKNDIPKDALVIQANQQEKKPKKAAPKKTESPTKLRKRKNSSDPPKPKSPWGKGYTREDFYDE